MSGRTSAEFKVESNTHRSVRPRMAACSQLETAGRDMMSGPPSTLMVKSMNGLLSSVTVILWKNGGSSMIGVKTSRTIVDTCRFFSPSVTRFSLLRCNTTSGSPAQRTSKSTTMASTSSSCSGTALIPKICGGVLPSENLEKLIRPYSELPWSLSSMTFLSARQMVELSAGHSKPSSSCAGFPASHSGDEIHGGSFPSMYLRSSGFNSLATRTCAANRALLSRLAATLSSTTLATSRYVWNRFAITTLPTRWSSGNTVPSAPGIDPTDAASACTTAFAALPAFVRPRPLRWFVVLVLVFFFLEDFADDSGRCV